MSKFGVFLLPGRTSRPWRLPDGVARRVGVWRSLVCAVSARVGSACVFGRGVMGARAVLDTDREEQLRKLWSEGANYATLKRELAIGNKALARFVKELPLPPRGQVMRALPSDAHVDDIIRLHESGLTPWLIGKKLNIGHIAVSGVLSRKGIEPIQGKSGPKPKHEHFSMGEHERARVEAQEVEAGCVACDWRATGSFAATRMAFRLHDCPGHAAVAA